MNGKRCWICGAGAFTSRLFAPKADDVIVAADGGLRHLKALGVQADFILGDFDSLGYCPQGENVQAYAPEKDDTDMLLAVKQGLLQGCDTVLLYGGLGGRLSHTIANLQLLYWLRQQGKHGFLVGEDSVMTVLSHQAASFDASCEGMLSVFAQDGAARGVRLAGLKYELENGTLEGNYPIGVSNEFVGRSAAISVTQGALLLIWEHPAADFSKITFETNETKESGEN